MDIFNKSDVLNYINEHNKEHGGHLTTESGFKKNFPSLYDDFIKTSFPSFFEGFDFKQKLWHFLRDDYTQHICLCGNPLKFRSFWYGYNMFCRINCPSMVEHQKECIKDINSKRTEDEKKSIQEKVKESFLERYGVERYSQTKEWKEKTLNTNKEKYGCEWFSKTDIYKDSFKKKSLEKYGVSNPMFSDVVRKKWKDTINKKTLEYWYNKYPDIISINGNELTCRCYDETCDRCSEKSYVIDKSLFSNRVCYGIDLCTIRNPYNPLFSGGERELLNFIKSIYDGEIIENDRSVLRGKELDIYIPELNLAFEFNGVYWHNEFNKEITYHQKKSLSCMKKGIQLIHIWEDDWLYKNEIIKDFIKSKFGVYDVKIGARKCEVKIVPNNIAYLFLMKNHIQGGVKNGKSIGLYYCNELVEILTFGGLRRNMGGKQVDGHYEIYRVCSKIGYNIQGGFSKLLNYFENVYNPIEIITYANLDYSVGNVYIVNGFCKCGISKPVYSWVVGGIRKNRSNFMKSKLDECKKNPNLTETDVMHSKGFWKCWDSGKIKFIKKR